MHAARIRKGLVVAAVLGIVTWSVARDGTRAGPIGDGAGPGVGTRLEPDPQASSGLDALNRKVAMLQQTQRGLATSLETLTAGMTGREPLPDDTGRSGGKDGRRPEKAVDPIVQADAMMTRLDTRLDDEAEDTRWSGPTEARIAKVFSFVTAKGSSLVSAECRSTLCRTEMAHESVEARAQLLESLQFTEPFNTEGFVHVFDAGGPRSVVYVARAGHRLSDVPEN